MSFFVEDKGNFEVTPTGNHLARCYRIIDLGTQKSEYMDQVKYLRKVMLGWEVYCVDDDNKPVRMNDGRPFAIFKNYTLSWADKATLRLDLASWRNKPFSEVELRKFDLKTILGVWCMLNIIERPGKDGKSYTNVSGITPVPPIIKQQGFPEAVNEVELFQLDSPDFEMFEKFSVNLKKKIESSPEWAKATNTKSAPAKVEEDLDDVPF